jgi:hypothetical protein
MSLLGWLGKEATAATTTKTPKKVSPRSLSPLLDRYAATPRVVLGVLGTRSNMRFEELEEQILAPILEAWGMPDELIIPAEGDSSQALQSWAIRKEVPVRLFTCDWIRNGKRAGLLRDSGIQREATHLVLLQGPRSNAMMTLAERLTRKGRNVVISERPHEPVKSVGIH